MIALVSPSLIAFMRIRRRFNVTKKSSHALARLVPEQMRGLFGDRPLVADEMAETYDKLLADIAATLSPRDTIDWLYVKDFVDITWEIHRIRRFVSLIINNQRGDSLSALLANTYAPDMDIESDRQKAKKLAVEFQLGEKNAKDEVEPRLAKFAISESAILAEAFQQRIDTVEKANRILAAAESRRSRILREIEQRHADLGKEMHRIVEAETKEAA